MSPYQSTVRGEGRNYNVGFKDKMLRVIFEEPPRTIQGVCVATNVAGVDRQLFKIKFLRY